MSVLALIPARGGSVGIPRKNLVEVGGRPLVTRAIDAAAAAGSVDRVVVSTDDDEIASVAAAAGAEIVRRPAALAGAATPALPVMLHALDELGPEPEAVVYLQPTSPFRTAAHIDAAVGLLRSGADAVVTVVCVPHGFGPASLVVVGPDGFVRGAGLVPPALRRQDKESFLARNGPAVLVARPASIRAGVLYPPRTVALEMSRLESIDIDDDDDLVLARALAEALDGS